MKKLSMESFSGMNEIKYFRKSIKSLGHTPIYKMHKYFARRPHNVFKALIEHYTKEGDTIFDPFGGGGVTLVEGLSAKRRVISSDINPIASFIQDNQVSNVEFNRFNTLLNELYDDVHHKLIKYYQTDCCNCGATSDVRWFEHTYIVKCPSCNERTTLRNDDKALNINGKSKNGFYKCCNCEEVFKAVNAKRIGSKILNIRSKCESCGEQLTKEPSEEDIKKFLFFDENYQKLVSDFELTIPQNIIPEEWDRQQEDCLHRKGFFKFTDLFTKRNLITSAMLFKSWQRIKNKTSKTEYDQGLFLISSLLRYTNNMTISTSSWMDGRPVAWAKHAYWTPNQFIETNPFEYFKNRVKAFKAAIKDRKSRFSNKLKSDSLCDFLAGTGDYYIYCGDSGRIDILNNSVDFILTDPPYGSNVQYAELCKFWDVWLSDKISFQSPSENYESEAVVHRKTKDHGYSKNFSKYYELLNNVFSNSYRVLKPGGVMSFTFNNKDIRAWYAVMKATLDAGFYIEKNGIFYQEGIDAYRDTAHLRFDGTPQGDFIYTFVKTDKKVDFSEVTSSFKICLEETLYKFIKHKENFTTGQFYIELFSISTLCLIKQIVEGYSQEDIESEFASSNIENFLSSNQVIIKKEGIWVIKDDVY